MTHVWASATIYSSVPAIANMSLAIALIIILRRHLVTRQSLASPTPTEVARYRNRTPQVSQASLSAAGPIVGTAAPSVFRSVRSESNLVHDEVIASFSLTRSQSKHVESRAPLARSSDGATPKGSIIRSSNGVTPPESYVRSTSENPFFLRESQKSCANSPIKVRLESPGVSIEFKYSNSSSCRQSQVDRHESSTGSNRSRFRMTGIERHERSSRQGSTQARELSIALLQVFVSIFRVALSLPLTLIFPAFALVYTAAEKHDNLEKLTITSNVSSFFLKSVGLSHAVNFFIYLIQVLNFRNSCTLFLSYNQIYCLLIYWRCVHVHVVVQVKHDCIIRTDITHYRCTNNLVRCTNISKSKLSHLTIDHGWREASEMTT